MSNFKFDNSSPFRITILTMERSVIFLSIIFSFLVVISSDAADYGIGMDAALKGDYLSAYKEWKPLADRNEATPQFQLGWLYEKGLGVNLDYKKAVKWYRRAAEQGYAYAQTALGRMYAQGRGIKLDVKRAYMWVSIAAGLWDTDAKAFQVRIAETMTSSEIISAQQLTQECVTKKFKNC